MTDEQCSKCKFAPKHGFSTCGGDELPVWDCEKMNDPMMPFTMESDTDCPCYEEE